MKKLSKILTLILSSSILISNIGIVRAVKPDTSTVTQSEREQSVKFLNDLLSFKCAAFSYGFSFECRTGNDMCITKKEIEESSERNSPDIFNRLREYSPDQMRYIADNFKLFHVVCALKNILNTKPEQRPRPSSFDSMESEKIINLEKEDIIDLLYIAGISGSEKEIPDVLKFNRITMKCCKSLYVELKQDRAIVFKFCIPIYG